MIDWHSMAEQLIVELKKDNGSKKYLIKELSIALKMGSQTLEDYGETWYGVQGLELSDKLGAEVSEICTTLAFTLEDMVTMEEVNRLINLVKTRFIDPTVINTSWSELRNLQICALKNTA